MDQLTHVLSIYLHLHIFPFFTVILSLLHLDSGSFHISHYFYEFSLVFSSVPDESTKQQTHSSVF